MITVSQPKFRLGAVVATPDAIAALERAGQSPWFLLSQHIAGQWGNLSDDDKRLNDEALIHGDRILSSYQLSDGTTVWCITEADRSSTCLLLPENY
jgi:hypothetical protein